MTSRRLQLLRCWSRTWRHVRIDHSGCGCAGNPWSLRTCFRFYGGAHRGYGLYWNSMPNIHSAWFQLRGPRHLTPISLISNPIQAIKMLVGSFIKIIRARSLLDGLFNHTIQRSGVRAFFITGGTKTCKVNVLAKHFLATLNLSMWLILPWPYC